MLIVWGTEASSDLAHIVRFIAERNPLAARLIKNLIGNALLPAVEHPCL